jgi:large subunit ribosomal protein L4
MKLDVVNLEKKSKGHVEIADELLIRNAKGTQAVHDAVVAYLANQRLGTANTKQMGEVAGTGKKPWRQKGTGRARAGSFQSPIWRGGAVVFGPKPRDYSLKVPKKVKALAFRKAFSDRLLAGDVIVVENFALDSHKTKNFMEKLGKLELENGSILLVVDDADDNLARASRNVRRVKLERASQLNTYEMLWADKIVVTKGALEVIKGRMTP